MAFTLARKQDTNGMVTTVGSLTRFLTQTIIEYVCFVLNIDRAQVVFLCFIWKLNY